MAYDKVVDSTVLENGLSSIADAIREKGNLGDPLMSPLNFPSGFVSAIEGLSGGGATGITTGVYIPASTGYDNVITHGLGVVPQLFAICAGGKATSGSSVLDSAHGFSDRTLLFRMSRLDPTNSPTGYIDYSHKITAGSFAKNVALAKATETTINVGGHYQLVAGIEYYWFALA